MPVFLFKVFGERLHSVGSERITDRPQGPRDDERYRSISPTPVKGHADDRWYGFPLRQEYMNRQAAARANRLKAQAEIFGDDYALARQQPPQPQPLRPQAQPQAQAQPQHLREYREMQRQAGLRRERERERDEEDMRRNIWLENQMAARENKCRIDRELGTRSPTMLQDSRIM
jgi:hypothetical protein